MALTAPLDNNTPGPPGDESKTTLSSESNHTLPVESVNIEKTEELSSEKDASTGDDEDEGEYPGKAKLALIVLSLNLATFLVGLDNTILSSAIPQITDHFHALNNVGWYASAYLLTNCSFQLMWGKLITFYSVKWVFLTSLFIFELGSLVCAVAPTSTALIIGRAIAGVGSGGGGTGGFILIARSVPRRQRPTLVGLMGAMYGFAAIAGPLLGGVFTDSERLTWRFCFYINLPLGFITIVTVMLCIPTLSPPGSFTFREKVMKMDIPGTICLFPGVICLLLGLEWGGSTYPWKSGRIIALLVLGVVLLSAFVVVQARSGDQATVPARVFLNRNIWGSALFGSCVTAAFFVMLYYIPIWFQSIKGVSAVDSGIRCLPMIISFVVFSTLGGTMTTVIGYYVQSAYMTSVFMAIGAGLLTTLHVDSRHAMWIGYQVIFGAGVGLGLQVAFSAPQTALPMKDVPIGTAIIMFTENLAAAIMVCVAQSVFANQLVSNITKYVPSIDAGALISAGATGLKTQAPAQLYGAVLYAYNLSLTRTFYVAVALSSVSVFGVVFLEWISVKSKKQTTAAQA